MASVVKLGVVGFSQNKFVVSEARSQLRRLFQLALRDIDPSTPIELVSGYSNMGIPKLAYEIGKECGWTLVGLAPEAIFRVRSGLFKVDKEIIAGKKFGDESPAFVAYIDRLVRVGGGPQSRKEVELFRERFGGDDAELSKRLFEVEIEWLGDPPSSKSGKK